MAETHIDYKVFGRSQRQGLLARADQLFSPGSEKPSGLAKIWATAWILALSGNEILLDIGADSDAAGRTISRLRIS
jgi:hypothetical protein